jgi:hypothetical protein
MMEQTFTVIHVYVLRVLARTVKLDYKCSNTFYSCKGYYKLEQITQFVLICIRCGGTKHMVHY